jgi:large repetitive protein
VRSALLGALVAFLVFACARPNATVLPSPSPTPTPSPSPTPTAPLQATTPPFHAGEVGVAYGSIALSATGGVQPYKWSVSAGSIPDGLIFGSNGTLTGTPTSAGNFGFTIQVADGGGGTASVNGQIGIAARLSAGLVPACVTQCSVELGCVNVCGTFGQVGGGIGPYEYALTSGQLPSGTTLSGLALTGTFKGLSGYLKFTVTVTDTLGATAPVSPTFWMYQHISLVGGTCYGDYGTGCTARLPIGGGNGGYAVQLVRQAVNATSNPPPYAGTCWPLSTSSVAPAPTVAVSGGYVVVSVPPRVNGGSGYGAIWTLRLSDKFLCAANTHCTAPDVTVTIGVQCG